MDEAMLPGKLHFIVNFSDLSLHLTEKQLKQSCFMRISNVPQ